MTFMILKKILGIIRIKGGLGMGGVIKGMLIVLMILYIISPIDFVPGPIDDILVLLLGIASQKGISAVED